MKEKIKWRGREIGSIEVVDDVIKGSRNQVLCITDESMRLFRSSIYTIGDTLYYCISSKKRVDEPFNTILEEIDYGVEIHPGVTSSGVTVEYVTENAEAWMKWKQIVDMAYEPGGLYSMNESWKIFTAFAEWYKSNNPQYGDFGSSILVVDVNRTKQGELDYSNCVFIPKSITKFPSLYKYTIREESVFSGNMRNAEMNLSKTGRCDVTVYNYKTKRKEVLGKFSNRIDARAAYIEYMNVMKDKVLSYLRSSGANLKYLIDSLSGGDDDVERDSEDL